jgi:tetratricopeptide (TPR) repeat protein
LIGLLFSLPKVIIDKEKQKDLSGAGAGRNQPAAGAESHEGHGHAEGEGHEEADAAHASASPEQLRQLSALRVQYRQEKSEAARVKLAGELAAKYAEVSKFDSAGYYYEQVAAARPGEKSFQKAADQYFEAFSFAATPERSKELGAKARGLYDKVLQNNPSNLDAKTNLAMTYIAMGEAPMQGVTLLREVIATDPNNQKALFNLGILSIQSGQHEKAIERFRHLTQVNPKHVQGHFYLAVSLAATGKKDEARQVFQKARKLDPDPGFQASVDNELAKLK